MTDKQPHHSKQQVRKGGKFWSAEAELRKANARPADDGRLPVDVKAPRAAPTSTLGVGGTVVWGGYIQEREKSSELSGVTKYKTFSNFLANVNIIAASVRLFLNMVGQAEWKVEPKDPESAEAVDLAEQVDELLFQKMKTPWNRIVRRLAMYKMYGFAVAEWIAMRLEDGRMGFKDVQPRPQITIERWLVDPHNEVLGVVQVDPQTGRDLPIPREKLIYVVDDAISDSPEGLGLMRHVAEASARLQRYLQLEGFGYEADMRGIPVGRAPLAELDNLIQNKKISKAKAQELLDGMADFLSSHVKNPAAGLMIDSTPYRQTGENRTPSPVAQWSIELLDGGTYGFAELHEAILRTQREMARVFGTEHMMLGENSAGSRALSNDKTTLFGLLVDDALREIREQVESDLVKPLFALNGWDEDLMPILKTDTQVFRNIEELTAALRDLSQGGVQFDRQDESVQEIMDLLGLTRFAPLEEIDSDLVISAAQAQEDAMAIMEGKAMVSTQNGEEPGEGGPPSSEGGTGEDDTPDEDDMNKGTS